MRFASPWVFKDGNGVSISGATAQLFLTGTSTPATFYAAATGGSPITTTTTDTQGQVVFYVDNSDYSYASHQLFDVSITAPNFSPTLLVGLSIVTF